jgi:hypothetical protein
VVRNAVGYHRYDTAAELSLLNQISAVLRTETNFFSPQQKLVEKHRHGAKVTKRYETGPDSVPTGPGRRHVPHDVKTALTTDYERHNPAQIRRDLLALQGRLLDLVKAKHPPKRLPVTPPRAAPTRAKSDEATKSRTRVS